jgi:hypothetical protein
MGVKHVNHACLHGGRFQLFMLIFMSFWFWMLVGVDWQCQVVSDFICMGSFDTSLDRYTVSHVVMVEVFQQPKLCNWLKSNKADFHVI